LQFISADRWDEGWRVDFSKAPVGDIARWENNKGWKRNLPAFDVSDGSGCALSLSV
jgi:hypothetical protein